MAREKLETYTEDLQNLQESIRFYSALVAPHDSPSARKLLKTDWNLSVGTGPEPPGCSTQIFHPLLSKRMRDEVRSWTELARQTYTLYDKLLILQLLSLKFISKHGIRDDLVFLQQLATPMLETRLISCKYKVVEDFYGGYRYENRTEEVPVNRYPFAHGPLADRLKFTDISYSEDSRLLYDPNEFRMEEFVGYNTPDVYIAYDEDAHNQITSAITALSNRLTTNPPEVS